MAISSTAALRRLCELRDWSVSNLEANKLLYFAHMVSLGESNGTNPMVNERFQAWDFGPVLPSVYHAVKMFGAKPIKPFALAENWPSRRDYDDALNQVINEFAHFSGPKLIAESHWPKGAWVQYYRPGAAGVDIPNDAITAEYRARTAQSAKRT